MYVPRWAVLYVIRDRIVYCVSSPGKYNSSIGSVISCVLTSGFDILCNLGGVLGFLFGIQNYKIAPGVEICVGCLMCVCYLVSHTVLVHDRSTKVALCEMSPRDAHFEIPPCTVETKSPFVVR